MKNNIYPNSPLNLRPVQASKLLPVIYSSMLPDVRCRDLSRTGTPGRTFPWHSDIWYGMHSRLACAEGSGHPLRERFSAVPLPSSDPDRELHLKETVYKDKPDMAELNLDDLERIGKLYNPYHIDRLVLRDRINKVLYDRQQTTLAEVIERNEGVEKGLSEVFGYIGVLKEYKTVVNEERQQYIVFAENKTISIPEIIITR